MITDLHCDVDLQQLIKGDEKEAREKLEEIAFWLALKEHKAGLSEKEKLILKQIRKLPSPFADSISSYQRYRESINRRLPAMIEAHKAEQSIELAEIPKEKLERIWKARDEERMKRQGELRIIPGRPQEEPRSTGTNDSAETAVVEHLRSWPIYIPIYLPPDTDPKIVKGMNDGFAQFREILCKNVIAYKMAKVSFVTINASGVEITPLSRPHKLEAPVIETSSLGQFRQAMAMINESIKKDVVMTTEDRFGDYDPTLCSFLGGQLDEDVCALTRGFGKQSLPIGLGPDVGKTLLEKCTENNAILFEKVNGDACSAIIQWLSKTINQSSTQASMRSQGTGANEEQAMTWEYADLPKGAKLVAA